MYTNSTKYIIQNSGIFKHDIQRYLADILGGFYRLVSCINETLVLNFVKIPTCQLLFYMNMEYHSGAKHFFQGDESSFCIDSNIDIEYRNFIQEMERNVITYNDNYLNAYSFNLLKLDTRSRSDDRAILSQKVSEFIEEFKLLVCKLEYPNVIPEFNFIKFLTFIRELEIRYSTLLRLTQLPYLEFNYRCLWLDSSKNRFKPINPAYRMENLMGVSIKSPSMYPISIK